MRHIDSLACIMISGILLVGCSKESGQKTPPPPAVTSHDMDQPKAPTDASEAPKPDQPSEGAARVEQQVKESATDAAAQAAPATQEAGAAAADAQEQLSKDAQSLLDKVLAAIKNGKLDEAEQSLKELEGKVGTLPAPLPDRIAAARKALDAARLAESAKSVLPKTTN